MLMRLVHVGAQPKDLAAYALQSRCTLFVSDKRDKALFLKSWTDDPIGLQTPVDARGTEGDLDLTDLIDPSKSEDGDYEIRVQYDDSGPVSWAVARGIAYHPIGIITSNIVRITIAKGSLVIKGVAGPNG